MRKVKEANEGVTEQVTMMHSQSSWGVLGDHVEMSQVIPFKKIASHQLLPVIGRGLLQRW